MRRARRARQTRPRSTSPLRDRTIEDERKAPSSPCQCRWRGAKEVSTPRRLTFSTRLAWSNPRSWIGVSDDSERLECWTQHSTQETQLRPSHAQFHSHARAQLHHAVHRATNSAIVPPLLSTRVAAPLLPTSVAAPLASRSRTRADSPCSAQIGCCPRQACTSGVSCAGDAAREPWRWWTERCQRGDQGGVWVGCDQVAIIPRE